MNYLAHAYLSFRHPEVTVGNMISDHVKGGRLRDYGGQIRAGILLHRAIDAYTDTHPSVRSAKEVFRPHYRLYASAIMDVTLDHFLANDAGIFTQQGLARFAADTYDMVEPRLVGLPDGFRRMFPYMKSEDWLTNYRRPEGLERSLHGLRRRARYMPEVGKALELIHEGRETLQRHYDAFMPDMRSFAEARFLELTAAAENDHGDG